MHGVPFYAFHKILRAAMNNLSITIRAIRRPGIRERGRYRRGQRQGDDNSGKPCWIWSDIDRRMALEKDYNEVMRAVAAPHFDGSFLALEGWRCSGGLPIST